MGTSKVIGTFDDPFLSNIGRDIEMLSRDLSCLIDLGVITCEEESACSAFLGDLRTALARAGSSAKLRDADRRELSGMARMLAADLDFAYQRLAIAA